VSAPDRAVAAAELSAVDQELIAEALAAREFAHAPYSGFCVGAAVRDQNGLIHRGCNVETASYGLTICAERVALFAAKAAGVTAFSAIAVAGPEHGNRALSPCGACRQVIHDLAGNLRILLATLDGRVEVWTASELLPAAFGADFLQQEKDR
jgi:cytidine deaminase